MVQAPSGEVLVFEAPDGGVRVEVKLDRETVWLTQQQMADLFGRERSVVTKHIRNTFQEGELDPAATCAKFAQVRTEGARTVSREVDHFNLDVVISVGYRVKSLRGTQFRLWATRTLREHLVRGYTLNRQRFEHNARELEAALALVRKAAAGEALSTDQGRGLVDVIARYTQTFLLLQRYDEGLLVEPKGIVGGLLPPAPEARAAIVRLKRDLLARGEATELFGREREDGLAALLGNLDQSVFGEPAYPTVEAKAAHLLYFVIKNHPFSDGNKRIGSFLFVEFLHRNGRLIRNGEAVINDVGLAALALLVAESAPTDKEVMIRLVMNMLAEPVT
ncbi:MAG: virulence protein RhuM/Fic/DOC family protein [Accumulibacter sp.]|jgi:prophage maintenance system killer protein|uniref:virulence protein RhuM/Fic/DOC family protein n=1 Tax=Accumulibacter sp. TaxID=2053492 RepID=UPI002FC34E0D